MEYSIKETQTGYHVYFGGAWQGSFLSLADAEKWVERDRELSLFPAPAGWDKV